MTLVKFNPVRELLDVEREFNKRFNTLGSRIGLSRKDDSGEYDNAVWMPLTDIYEDNDNYFIKAEFKDGQLTVTVPKADEVKPKEIEIKVS